MAISFREMPWYVQVLVFVTLAAIIVGLGEYVPFSPVKTARADLADLSAQEQTLSGQVNSLEVFQRRISEFRNETQALQQQLDTLQAIVPQEKNVDDFIRMVQSAAQSSGVELRHLTAGVVTSKDYHYEMPFDVEMDGPYYGILDFFARLSRLSRIINVGDLTIGGLTSGAKTKVPQRPGTSVNGKLTLTTYFSQPSDASVQKTGAKK
jgi:type IV pilus assembly protein PilO